MANVGNLNATLTLSAFEFNSGLKQSETAAMEFATTVETQATRASQSLTKVSNAANKRSQLINIGAQGLQDFASQVETRGIAAGLQAASNNAMQFATMVGSSKAGMIGLGIAVGSIVVPKLIDALDNTKAIRTEAEGAAEAFKRLEALNKIVANVEVNGGAQNAMKELEGQVKLNAQLRDKASQDLMAESKKLAVAKKALDEATAITGPFGIRIANKFDGGNELRELEAQFNAQKKLVDDRRAAFQKLTAEQAAAQDAINRIDPRNNQKVADKEQEEALMKQVDLEQQVAKQRRDASAEVLKRVEEYGTEMQRVEAKIAERRNILMQKGVSAEILARSDAMDAVDRKKAQLSEAEKKLNEMGQAAGMSAGVQRDTAAGISAVNRALAGTTSEQSLAKKAIKLQEDGLKVLEELVRKPVQQIRVVALSG